ncbi:PucR family transcriptional regulator ligand-binding domain-containing protein [Clostridiaceae bacterium M8S5]|nr:PucR family transcriptional regulator ligand-binding domain-containing protein [Clostridiaceae bacterium M8S5]
MGVLIRDLLSFKEFESARVIAGHKGLLNEVLRINFLELTLREFREKICVDVDKFISIGDLYLTSSNFFDKVGVDFYEEFLSLIRQRSCGICIVGYKEGTIDDSIIKLVNDNGYPIIALDYTTAYSNLIDIVMNAIVRDKSDKRIDNLLYKIMHTECSCTQILEYINEMNPNLKNNYVALYIEVPNNNITNMIRNRIFTNNREIFVHRLNKGTLVVISTDDDFSTIDEEIKKIKELLIKQFNNIIIGVSDYYRSLERFKESINEAIFSFKFARRNKALIVNHNDLGIETWLNKIKDDKDLLSYVNEVLEPIIKYEKENNIDLYKIIKAFVKYEGNYKRISKELYLHENTVRYRMDKIKDILKVGNNKVTLYTKLNIVVILKSILNLG